MKKYTSYAFKILLLSIIFFTTGCNTTQEEANNNNNNNNTIINNKYSIVYECQPNENAFNLLKQNSTSLDYSESDFGVFIKSINNITNNNINQKYWIYFVNNEMSLVAIDKYICKNNDIIEWKYGAEYDTTI